MGSVYHVSDLPDIVRFEPRHANSSHPHLDAPVVWAVDEAHLHNYLLPRDCPRVTFYAGNNSSADDVERILGGTSAAYVVAIESCRLAEVQQLRLYVYQLPDDSFSVYDRGAGYYLSREAVEPLRIQQVDNILGELLARDVELRIMPSLWKLRDQVLASSLQFSFIRMRNAQPRPE